MLFKFLLFKGFSPPGCSVKRGHAFICISVGKEENLRKFGGVWFLEVSGTRIENPPAAGHL
jgi:hypothetical protein